MFVYAIFKAHFPYCLWGYVERCSHTLAPHMYHYIEITFDEFSGERLNHSEVFSAIQNYLSIKASKHAARFKADVVEDSQSLVLSMEDKEEVTDEFERVNVWWELGKNISRREFQFSIYPAAEEKRYYKLTFHKRDRELIPGSYVNHVLDGGRPSQ
ncbi:hypothetical protein WN944_005448 [Citrus x changshan-huyou]